MALVALSTVAVIADQAELGTDFTGALAFGACPDDQPYDLGCGEPRIVEPFTDPRLEGGVAITGWSGGFDASSVVWFGSWLIGDFGRWLGRGGLAPPASEGWDSHAIHEPAGRNRRGQGPLRHLAGSVADGMFDFEGRIVRGDLHSVTDYSGVLVPGDLESIDW
jgi:hypothetical protein